MDLAQLERAVAGEVRTDPATRAAYAYDASVYRVLPKGVLVARSVDDLAAAVAYARASGTPLTMRGAGTSLAGQAVGAGLVVDCARLDRIVSIDPEARVARVEPGVVQAQLDRAAAAHGLTFGPDPATATRATVGGMVGNDSAGTRSVVYGRTSHRVRRVRAVFADGSDRWLGETDRAALVGPFAAAGRIASDAAAELDRRWPKILRCVDGYQLAALLGERPNPARFLCGSEGTLGVILEVEVELDPRPPARAWSLVRLPGLEQVGEATLGALRTAPCAAEFVDLEVLQGSRAARELGPDARAVLLVEHQGTPDEIAAARAALAAELPAFPVSPYADFTQLRRDMNGITSSQRDGGRRPVTVVEDAAVPVEHLADYLVGLRAAVRDAGTSTAIYGHASVGCVHARPLLDLGDPEDRARFRALAERGADLVASFGGALSGEHGDGILRAELLERVYGAPLVAAFEAVKQAFDPDGLFNPGRIVGAPPLDSHLKADGEDAADPALDGARSCVGLGVCVERAAGTMCPPYRVTRAEADSTRGRASLLRAIATGLVAADDPGVEAALGLCVGCKACASECGTAVDMAWLKAVHLDRVHRMVGASRRDRLLADAPAQLARASRVAPLANASAKVGAPVFRRLGLADRALPKIARRPFEAQVADRAVPSDVDTVLFVDTFSRYLEPEVALAALRCLERAGRRVAIAPPVCCGRTFISGGFLDEARARARATVDALAPFVAASITIVGVEPSCVATLRDELPRLLPDDERAAALAASALLFDEALVRFGCPEIRRRLGAIVIHPHCHQKALGAGGAPATLLTGGAGEVETLDAGCCGMAGSFGYHAEHAAISRAIAEDRLLPALRERAGATVVATGTSCRAQLRDLAGIEAVHPAVLLDRLTAP